MMNESQTPKEHIQVHWVAAPQKRSCAISQRNQVDVVEGSVRKKELPSATLFFEWRFF